MEAKFQEGISQERAFQAAQREDRRIWLLMTYLQKSQYHFYLILLVRAITEPAQIQKSKEIDFTFCWVSGKVTLQRIC